MARDVRAMMIAGAARLLARDGLDATSFADVLRETGAPRGSVYHHFPGGKSELVGEAVRYAGALLVRALDELRTDDPVEVITAFLGLWRHLLTGSDLRSGCAVAAVAIGVPHDGDLGAATAEVFTGWMDTLAARLERAGIAVQPARTLAVTAIAGVEGAIVLSRATHDIGPFDRVAEQLTAMVRHTATEQ